MKSKILTIAVIILAFVIEGFFVFKYSRNHSAKKLTGQEINQDSILAFNNFYKLATQFRLEEKNDSSISAYKKAIMLKPADENSLYYLGILYRKEREFDNAKQTWENLIKLDSKSERAFIQMGNLYFCMTHRKFFKPEIAESYFRKANELNKNSLIPLLRLGEVALFLEENQTAMGIFNKLSVLDQNNTEINFLNGYLYWKSNQEAKALASLKQAFLSAKNNITIAHPDDDDRQCNLFSYYTTAYITKSNHSDIAASMTGIFKGFDQYLILMRDQLNSH